MSGARGRRVHFQAVEDPPAPDTAIPSIGPVAFTVRLSEGDHEVDFSGLPCPHLVRGMAEALSRAAGESGTQRTPRTVEAIASRIRRFVKFVAATDPDAADSFALADVTPQLLDAYEHKLIGKYGLGSKTPYAVMVDLIRLLKEAQVLHPGVFSGDRFARTVARCSCSSGWGHKKLKLARWGRSSNSGAETCWWKHVGCSN